jgi:hypothetical protein
MRTRTLGIALLAVAIFAGACGRLNDDGSGGPATGGSGGTGGTGGSGGIEHPTGAGDLVLRVFIGGGFVPVEYNLRNLPGVSIYGDGRMIVTGPVIEIYPGPAMPNLLVTRLSEEAVQTILERAREAGLLGEDASYDYPCVADLPTTTFTVVADGATHTVSAYALGMEGEMGADTCGLKPTDVEARAALADFSAALGDLANWLPEGSMSAEEPYVPSEMRVYVQEYLGDPELEQTPIAWPLATPLGSFGEPDVNLPDIRCGVVAGDDLATLLPDAQAANQLTPWTSDGDEFGLIFRPLLPDEHTC